MTIMAFIKVNVQSDLVLVAIVFKSHLMRRRGRAIFTSTEDRDMGYAL